MTFFTGLDNPARYIYLFAGFKIAQSFADMKKILNNKVTTLSKLIMLFYF
ncbi:MAG: hypothetical protein ACLUG4_07560 [Bacilli bacterium]